MEPIEITVEFVKEVQPTGLLGVFPLQANPPRDLLITATNQTTECSDPSDHIHDVYTPIKCVYKMREEVKNG